MANAFLKIQSQDPSVNKVQDQLISLLNPALRTIADHGAQLASLSQISWLTVGAAGEPAFANSWVDYGSPFDAVQFYKDSFGWVHLRGLAKSGTVGQAIFTLPAGYRPLNYWNFAVDSNNAFGKAQVAPTGEVIAGIGSNVFFSLHGISFPAEQ